MKTKEIKIIALFVLLFLCWCAAVFAQSPESFKYQAVIRDASGEVVANETVGIQIIIVQGSADGASQYQETFALETNGFGLVNLSIGTGNVINGNFSNIDWANGPYFVRVGLDLNGGQNFTTMGSSQLMSVPYALHANTVQNDSDNQTLSFDEDNNELSISDGNTITLPSTSEGDDWGSQVVETDGTLSGDGSVANPLEVVGDLTDDQQLSFDGTTLTLEGGGQVDLSVIDTDSDDQTLSFNNGTGELTISEGNTITLPTTSGGDNWGSQVAEVGSTLIGDGSSARPLEVVGDLTDDQQLSFDGTNLSLEDGGSVDISGINTNTQLTEAEVDAFADNNGYLTAEVDGSATNEIQDISFDGTSLSISDGSTIDLSVIDTDTDTQLTEAEVDAFANNNGYLTAEVDGSITNEIQDLQLVGDVLTITDNVSATEIDLSAYLDNDNTLLEDADQDTKIQVEESADEDVIRFDIGGNEKLRMTANSLEILNTGQSIFIGRRAGQSDDLNANNNIAIGDNALPNNIDGNRNIAIGTNSLSSIEGGGVNVAIGFESLANNITGYDNVVIGPYAGLNATGNRNIFLGMNAGKDETGSNFLYIENSDSATPLIWGDFANDSVKVHGTLSVGDAFTFPSTDGIAGQVITTYGDGQTSWSTIDNTLLEDADQDTKIQVEENPDEDVIRFDIGGSEKWRMTSNAIEVLNTGNSVFIGQSSGNNDDLTSNANVGIGRNSLRSNVDGAQNAAIGTSSLYSNTSGTSNVSIGYATMRENLIGINNTAIGKEAGRNATGNGNVFLGHQAGFIETGDNLLYIENTASSSPLIWGDFANDSIKVFGTLSVGNNYTLPATDGTSGQMISTDGDGQLSWSTVDTDDTNEIQDLQLTDNTLTITGNGSATDIDLSPYLDNDNALLEDADQDTKIQVEESSDEDRIRFDIGGTERWVMIGNRLESVNSGRSTMIGRLAGQNDDLTTNQNVFVGYATGFHNSSGQKNSAIGYEALNQNIEGDNNTAMGHEAGRNTLGSRNIFLGFRAGMNETGSDKLYIESSNSDSPLIWGDFANDSLKVFGTLSVGDNYTLPAVDGTSGQIISTDGDGLLSWVTADTDDTNEIQDLQLTDNTLTITGNGSATDIDLSVYLDNDNTLLEDADQDTKIQVEESADEDIIRFDIEGTEVWRMNGAGLEALNTGRSVFIGEDAGKNDDLTNNDNVFIGYQSGRENSDGTDNTAIGASALRESENGSRNTVVGSAASLQNTGSNNTSLGYEAGRNSTGSGNVFLGYQAGRTETGSNELYIENSDSGTPLIWGDFANDSVRVNGVFRTENWVMTGTRLEPANTGSSVFIGEDAGNNDDLSDNFNTGIGTGSLQNISTGQNNVAVGNGTMVVSTTGEDNVAVGSGSLFSNATGTNNTAIGATAGAAATGSNNVFIGYAAGFNETGDNRLYIDNSNTAAPLIWGDFGSNQVRINGSLGVNTAPTGSGLRVTGTTYVNGNIQYTGTITDVSDRRLKENFKSIDNVMDKIHQITGLSYNMKDDSLKVREYGVIAQDVQKVFPEMVTIVEEEGQYLGVSYTQLIPILLEAIKEQQEQIESQVEKIQNLTEQNAGMGEVMDRLAKIEAMLNSSGNLFDR